MSARETILWLDAAAGAAGDMIVAALVDAGAPFAAVRGAVASLSLDGVRVMRGRAVRGAVSATRVEVKLAGRRGEHDDHHLLDAGHDHGRSWRDIRRTIAQAELPTPVRDRALVIFRRLIEAEAEAHGCAVDAVHLHEAGAADAIADVVAACAALHALRPDRIVVSPVTTGSGTVACAHGLYPVPGPATSLLLRGVPLSGIAADGERLTPTGAAILTSIAHAYGGLPAMTLRRVGFGAGARDYPERPNVVRAVLGDRSLAAGAPPAEIVVLELTVDDATPQLVAHAAERLAEAGALDVHVTSVMMKKGRPGHLLTALTRPDAFDAVARAALAETTTLGVRFHREQRIELDRTVERVETAYGPIRVKTGILEGEALHAWPEYDDCAAAARRHGVPLLAVQRAALAAGPRARRRRPAKPKVRR